MLSMLGALAKRKVNASALTEFCFLVLQAIHYIYFRKFIPCFASGPVRREVIINKYLNIYL